MEANNLEGGANKLAQPTFDISTLTHYMASSAWKHSVDGSVASNAFDAETKILCDS